MFEITDYEYAGVYAIINQSNKRVYIGSSETIRTRCLKHEYLLKKGRHHCKLLQSDYNLGYSFKVIVLEKVSMKWNQIEDWYSFQRNRIELLNIIEAKYQQMYYPNIYNTYFSINVRKIAS